MRQENVELSGRGLQDGEAGDEAVRFGVLGGQDMYDPEVLDSDDDGDVPPPPPPPPPGDPMPAPGPGGGPVQGREYAAALAASLERPACPRIFGTVPRPSAGEYSRRLSIFSLKISSCFYDSIGNSNGVCGSEGGGEGSW